METVAPNGRWLVLLLGLAVLVLAFARSPAVAPAQPTVTHQCRKVVIKTDNGVVYTRAYEIVAFRLGCGRARRIVNGFLKHSEGNRHLPKPLGFQCRSGRSGGKCRKGAKRVWWSYNPNIGCRNLNAPYPCSGERPCGGTPTVSEGVRITSAVFARGISCGRARSIVRIGRPPVGWSANGSGEGGVYYRGSPVVRPGPVDLLGRVHARYSNVVLL